MSATATQIIQDIVQTLRDSQLFAYVAPADAPGGTDLPRAKVEFDAQEHHVPDDAPAGRWVRLRARVTVQTRSDRTDRARARLVDLLNAAAEALLADPYRGGLCCDLPIGSATQIGRFTESPGIRRPELQGSFTVTCHFEQEAG